MCPAIEINRHRALPRDALRRKYRRARETAPDEEYYVPESDGPWYDDDYDDFWDPQRCRTADDHVIFDVLEQALGFVHERPKLGDLLAERAPREEDAPTHESIARRSPPDLEEALFAHVGRIVARARFQSFAFAEEIDAELARVNGGRRGVVESFARFGETRFGLTAPIVMALLFTPFWVRPLASFRAPEGDKAAVTTALVEHLFQIYPVPRALHTPWLAAGLPSLKWVCWLILLGQGGNLHRAARLFGWRIPKRFTHIFTTAPADLTAVEACMWFEVARLGGSRADLDRLRQNPAYVIDPTEGPVSVIGPQLERAPEEAARIERAREFWHDTVAWIVRWREELTDASASAILEWAMHLHAESNRWMAAPSAGFSWRGRTPASAHEAAIDYLRIRDTPHADLVWRARGLEWQSDADEAWTIRELTSSKALAEESRAMHHCVASYAYRCARGLAAIFSLCAGGVRRITIELDPFTHRVVQARGVCNRATTHEEQTMISRWLTATSPERERPKGSP